MHRNHSLIHPFTIKKSRRTVSSSRVRKIMRLDSLVKKKVIESTGILALFIGEIVEFANLRF